MSGALRSRGIDFNPLSQTAAGRYDDAIMEKKAIDITTAQRNEWLVAEDPTLLNACAIDAYRASGPGGQKRNKTSSAVRLRHAPSGLMVISEESRSQHANKRVALRRLRMAIAIRLRPRDAGIVDLAALTRSYVTPDGRLRLSDRNDDFPMVIAAILDHIHLNRGSLKEVAESIGVSQSQVIRILLSEDAAFAEANGIRESNGLTRLRRT